MRTYQERMWPINRGIYSWGVAVISIVGRREMINQVHINCLNDMLGIAIILLRLLAGGYIMAKNNPSKA